MTQKAQRRQKGGAAHSSATKSDVGAESPQTLNAPLHVFDTENGSVKALHEKLSKVFDQLDTDDDSVSKYLEGDVTALTVAQRFALLDRQVPVSNGVSASDHARELFPELARLEIAEAIPPMPTEAPEPWADARKKGEQLGDFIRRVYGVWIGHGLTKADIRGLDFQLYTDLYQRKNRALVLELAIPAIAEYNSHILRRLCLADDESPLSALDVLIDRKSVSRLLGIVATRRPHGSR